MPEKILLKRFWGQTATINILDSVNSKTDSISEKATSNFAGVMKLQEKQSAENKNTEKLL